MPMRDKTGPMGLGPRTGRGMGPCMYGKPKTVPMCGMNGMGMARRRGLGRGHGCGLIEIIRNK